MATSLAVWRCGIRAASSRWWCGDTRRAWPAGGRGSIAFHRSWRGRAAVRGRLVRREELTSPEREAMFDLLAASFEGVTRERFAADLVEKTWALLLEDETGLRGFSTLLLYESAPPGEEVCTVVYS